ncbi:DUF2007 domain-containing protein [Viridibacterium curvum]|uniref:DUF2007 domain-containing protein n=1 Tax=Viridibacterium curvum TaxID=1101404 RepID=A0ABP9Q834_9RHOO
MQSDLDTVRQNLHGMESDDILARLRAAQFSDQAAEVARDELRARGVPLPAEPPSAEVDPSVEAEDWVILENNLDATEAKVLFSLLESENIPALVDDFNTANAFGHLAITIQGVRVRVPQSQALAAREILQEFSKGKLTLIDADDSEAPVSLEEQRFTAWTGDPQIARRWLARSPRWPDLMLQPLIFGPTWFFFRKLYLPGALLLLLEIGLLAFAQRALTPEADTALTPQRLLMFLLLVRLGAASFADVLLHKAALAGIQRARDQHIDEATLQRALRRLGGINFPAALGVLVTYWAAKLAI